MSVVDALAYRAFKICDDDTIEEELNHIRKQLKQNGFPIKFINSRIQIMKTRVNQVAEEEEESPRLILPFMGPLTARLTQYLRRRIGCKFGFIPGQKIGSLLCNAKEKPRDTPPGIYKIICSCKKIYIGETKRPYKIRIDEHFRENENNIRKKSKRDDLKRYPPDRVLRSSSSQPKSQPTNLYDYFGESKDSQPSLGSSAVAKHLVTNPTHDIQKEDTALVECEPRYFHRKFKERRYISKSNNTMNPTLNLRRGIDINPIWSSLLLPITRSP